ncbi:hypothetical protein RHMOL_Rhmol03G0139000 [Rhododendron molle]|uniref:Uncharacterized protein n=1 Tax=Rhododendron molle TaxID=49168 RepID=A0ACC0PFM4_RHOML|nr:hypothetical protein RHMOL_Rhmol03G0139000 [Rhododendron molle]
MDSLLEINLVLENLDHQPDTPQISPSDSPRMLARFISTELFACPTSLLRVGNPPLPSRIRLTSLAGELGRKNLLTPILEENYLGPAPYCDFKGLAQTQKTLRLAEVKTPHYPVDFKESNKLGEEPNCDQKVAEANATAYCFNQDLHYYALVKERIEKLRDQILNFNSESFEVIPRHANKKLRRCFKRKQRRHPKKEAQLQRKAKALMLSFRPLLKKLESDTKEAIRKMELQFLQFA